MTRALATYVRGLDPRLKMATAFVLGPSLWALHPTTVLGIGSALLVLLMSLAIEQPLGRKMVRSLFVFTGFWVGLKILLDSISGLPVSEVLLGGGDLAVRLISLLLLGMTLALSTSARSLGLAVSWFLRPVVGQERAWKVALSLALMIHFLPICISTMTQVRDTFQRRCPDGGLRQQLIIVPLAVMRNLGQKTWNQTLAVAGRGLEGAHAWEPDFNWQFRDSALALLFLCIGLFLYSI